VNDPCRDCGSTAINRTPVGDSCNVCGGCWPGPTCDVCGRLQVAPGHRADVRYPVLCKGTEQYAGKGWPHLREPVDRLNVAVKRVVHELRRLSTPDPPTEKLVRHRVPAFFEAEGERCETRVADRSEMLGLLRTKLIEETEELVEAIGADSRRGMLEEAVDLWEVIDALRAELGSEVFDALRTAKFHDRGSFHQGIVLKLAPPVPMVLHCPKCDGQHIDRGVWASTRIHRTHLCETCGATWKPFEYATVGVEREHDCAREPDKCGLRHPL
jgi:predicted house-cleaning noncanonical NTP pyrophosphatase (MazG superfamily)